MRVLLAHSFFKDVNLYLTQDPFNENEKETVFRARVTVYTILFDVTFICIGTYI